MVDINIELLFAPGCSGEKETEILIRNILSELKLENKVRYSSKEVTTDNLSDYPIYGSPTVLVNGSDIELGRPPVEKKNMG